MTAPATTRRAGPFNGNGVTTSFPFTFKVFATSDIRVILTDADGLDSTLTLGSDYTVTLNGDQDASPGGSITYSLLAVGEKLTAIGAIPYDQTADLPTGGNYRAVVIENALDRGVFQVQQLVEELGRALTLPASAATADTELPAPQASKVIGWNETGTALTNYSPAELATVVISGTSYFQTFNGTGAQTQFVLTADPGSVNALDVALDGVPQKNGIDFTVSGTTLTFVTAPGAGTQNIAVRYVAAVPVGSANAQDVIYQSYGTVEDELDRQREQVVNLRDPRWGVVGDGVTDDTTAILLVKAWAIANRPCTIHVPQGTYCYTDIGNWAYAGLWLVGQNHRACVFKRTSGSGPVFEADAFKPGLTGNDATAPFIQSMNVRNITFEGTATTAIGIRLQGLARCHWQDVFYRVGEPTAGVAWHLFGCMLNNWTNIGCSTDLDAMASVPYEGIILDAGTRDGVNVGNSSNNTLLNYYFEGLGIGVRLSGADQVVALCGCSESNSVYDVLVGSGSRYNTFIGGGFESIAATANIADAGTSNRFINCYTNVKVLLQGTGGEVSGGYHERIEVQAGAVKNFAHDLVVSNWHTGAGGFFDSGTATEWKNLRGVTFTASFSGTVMTVSAVAQGTLAVGQEIFADDISLGVTISSFGTGAGGTGTYNLSANVGVLASRSASSGGYIYPLAPRTAIVVGASPFTYTNTSGLYQEVVVQAGTVSQIRQGRAGDFWLKPAVSPTVHLLPPDDVLEVTYSVLPAMSYVPHNGFQG